MTTDKKYLPKPFIHRTQKTSWFIRSDPSFSAAAAPRVWALSSRVTWNCPWKWNTMRCLIGLTISSFMGKVRREWDLFTGHGNEWEGHTWICHLDCVQQLAGKKNSSSVIKCSELQAVYACVCVCAHCGPFVHLSSLSEWKPPEEEVPTSQRERIKKERN